jgi:hypothetical protein
MPSRRIFNVYCLEILDSFHYFIRGHVFSSSFDFCRSRDGGSIFFLWPTLLGDPKGEVVLERSSEVSFNLVATYNQHDFSRIERFDRRYPERFCLRHRGRTLGALGGSEVTLA